MSEYAALRFSQASMKPEKSGTVEANHECTLKQGCFEHALFSHNKAFTERMELSQHIWDLKKRNSDNTIHWSILCKVFAPHRNSYRIATCAPPEKKPCITITDTLTLLNKRSELISKCQSQTYTNFVPINLLDFFSNTLLLSIDLY